LAIRFEELIEEKTATLRRILNHAEKHGFPVNIPRKQALLLLDSAINPETSPTYRSGKTGKWREAFTEEHKSIFKGIAGDLLIRLGYEEDENW
jgi:hypothetical protein